MHADKRNGVPVSLAIAWRICGSEDIALMWFCIAKASAPWVERYGWFVHQLVGMIWDGFETFFLICPGPQF